MNSASREDLGDVRKRIDELDRQLIGLLKDRMDAVQDIGSAKNRDQGAAVFDPRRERELREKWAKDAEAQGLSSFHTARILREILSYSRSEQVDQQTAAVADGMESHRVGYQGEELSYSHLCIQKLFASRGGRALPRGYESFRKAVEGLQSGEVDYLLLPVENSICGSIPEVNQHLASGQLSVVDEDLWIVEHCLAGLPGAEVNNLQVLHSHPVALAQCQEFLASMPSARAEAVYDTGAAARKVAEEGDRSIAAICSEEAAEHFGLEVLRRSVGDQPKNLTRFLLLGRQEEELDLDRPAKTSLVLSVHHRRGALAEVLQVFAERDVNLTRLESRPIPESPFEYLFFIDLEGHARSEHLREALQEIRRHCNHLKVIGSYPARPLEARDVHLPPVETGPPAVAPVVKPAAALAKAKTREVMVSDVPVGGADFVLMAGPCAVENRDQIMSAAAMVAERGASILRGGAFKPRTSPYSFQGLGFPGLDLLVEAGRAVGLPVVTEVLRPEDVEGVAASADMLQVGARNMQNFALLKELGKTRRPILLKRGMSATIKELLQAAEYVFAGGNQQVILCERGIRTFETSTRSTLDVSAVPVLRELCDLPIIIDPSHAAGRRELVLPLAMAGAAAGADGMIVESHPEPDAALCDKEQALHPEDLQSLVQLLKAILAAQGRRLYC